MLFYRANFQIPNSGIQSAEVYAVAEDLGAGSYVVKSYADRDLSTFLFEKEYALGQSVSNIYEYLLSLDEYLEYEVVV